MNQYEDPSQVIRLKKLPIGSKPFTMQQLQATNSKSNKPTATIIAINHVNDNHRFTNNPNGYGYNGGGHYIKNQSSDHSYGHYGHRNNYIDDHKGIIRDNRRSSMDKYNGSCGTPSVTPSTTNSCSPSPCSSPTSRPMVKTPIRSSSLVKNNSKSLNNLHKNGHKSAESTTIKSSLSTNKIDSVDVHKVPSGILDDSELLQIELNYKSHKTFVYVCRCLANLYFTKTDLINGGRVSSPRSNEWELTRTGVPVIVFDQGETRSRPRRLVQLILAERGSGFPLWRDIIDNLTDYKSLASTFHTLYLSSDHRKMAGLSFDSNVCAGEFLNQIECITSDPINVSLTGPKKKRLSKSQERERKALVKAQNNRKQSGGKSIKKIIKSEISAPCLFQHVTSVDLTDFDKLFSVSSLMLPPPPVALLNGGHGDEGDGDSDSGNLVQNGGGQVMAKDQVRNEHQLVNQRLSQLKISSNSPRSHSSSSPPPSVSSSVSTIDFDPSPVPSPSLQLPIPVPPPMPPPLVKMPPNGIIRTAALARKINGQKS